MRQQQMSTHRVVLASLLIAFAASRAIAAPPNFVVMIADDCTYSDLACYGGQAHTPHLDRLCSEGMQFDRCFQAAPMCSPTRHALYTGIYPVRSGAYPNHTFAKTGTQSVAHYLKAAGYRVALSGKTHINPPESFPFEYSKGTTEIGKGNNPDWPAIDTMLTECRKSSTPFCLFVCSNEPHTPYTHGDPSVYDRATLTLPPHYVDTPATREAFQKYLAEVSFFDKQVGICLELLDRHQLKDETLLIVLSEQGNSFPFAKWTCYDAGLQSGMIVRWPGKVKAGSRTAAMVEYVDIVPTLLEAAGQKNPRALEGRSFLSVLSGSRDHHKQYSFGLQTSRGINNGPESYGIRSVRSEQYRYILNLSPEVEFRNAVFKTGWWKTWEEKAAGGNKTAASMIQRYIRRPAVELYDCQADPWNIRNLAGDPNHKQVQERLARELQRWMKSQGDLGQETEMAARQHQWRNRARK